MNNMRFIRNLLYSLKRQYGSKITIYQFKTYEVDTLTGLRNSTRLVTPINHVIVLPDTLARKFAYEHAFLMANRPFTYGGQWDQGQRTVIVDGQDLPKDLVLAIDDSVVFENQRYTIKTADKMDSGYGYLLTLIRAQSNLPLQILSFNLSQNLCYGHSVSKT